MALHHGAGRRRGASGKSIVPMTRSGWLTDLGDKGVELHDHPVGAAGDVKAGDDRWLVGRAEVEAEMAEVVIDRYRAGRSEHPSRSLKTPSRLRCMRSATLVDMACPLIG